MLLATSIPGSYSLGNKSNLLKLKGEGKLVEKWREEGEGV